MSRPPRYQPMLAATGRLPQGPVFVEAKHDGVRTMITVHDGVVELRSRRGFDVTHCYPELLVPPPPLAGRSLVLDGEVIAASDNGRGDFQLLQARMNVARPTAALRVAVPVVFVAFDLLWRDGHDLTSRPLRERREELECLELGGWQLTPRLDLAVGPELEAVCDDVGLEGLVVKAAESRYTPGRSRSWVKLKRRRRERFLVGDLLAERRHGSRIGSLAVGAHDERGLRYVGQVGYAFGQQLAARLAAVLESLVVDECPFVDRVEGPLRWVEPFVVVEVEYREATFAGTLRQPVLVGLAPEARASDVRLSPELAARVGERRDAVRIAAGQRF
jgi:bifunctional non-homologous end joining protein LigD